MDYPMDEMKKVRNQLTILIKIDRKNMILQQQSQAKEQQGKHL